MPMQGLVLPLESVGKGDVASVGGKNASLGEMLSELGRGGIHVPSGFATTAEAYRRLLRENGLEQPIRDALEQYRIGKANLRETGGRVRSLVLNAAFPPELEHGIRTAYERLCKAAGQRNLAVAVRSSATAEDLAEASFAGQQESFLNVRGLDALLDACRRCYASLFTDRAITYRELKGFDHLDVALSIGIQRMVRSDKAGSGVIFTLDPDSGFPRVVVISAAWGLGEMVVKGAVDPDRLTLFKPLLEADGAVPIIGRSLGAKERKMVLGRSGERTRIVATSGRERRSFVLTDEEALQLARWAATIERHYGRPMDIEWAKDGLTGELFILQARPETVHSTAEGGSFDIYRLKGKGPVLVSGAAVGQGIVSGPAAIVRTPADAEQLAAGSVLVAEATDPDWVPALRHAGGIVTDHGGTTSHAAIVSRELGIPAVIGTGNATRLLRNGQEVTLSCASGERGLVYAGALPFTRETLNVGSLPEPPVDVMVNIADPGGAFRWWRLPAKGVGLARMEFIISALIRLHPMAAAHPERLTATERRRVEQLSAGHASPADYFVDRLARGIATLAAPYHPHPAIVRLSDFKTNEYAGLLGGAAFEEAEENPMLGFRGASRYYSDRYRDGFALECRALRQVREELGFTNVIVMVPFCRSPAEADRVLAEMAKHGLQRGENGLQVYVMCEIPSNVILADEFARRFDGFSIGSNDLTQLVLGVDRDSALLAELFDERDEAVMRMVTDTIAGAHRGGIKVGICGQAPSNSPEFARFLIARGIDSISLNPDSFVTTVKALSRMNPPASARPAPNRTRAARSGRHGLSAGGPSARVGATRAR
ncbi:phosphoenolpyruvate synthase [Sphingomonas sp. GCM10030256]|uniref:phosphoenolpyruvate synthase n=1 Tax=Sphingomonas sp. GCM10030256 TaxID=3273427 RepID=UPI00361A9F8F